MARRGIDTSPKEVHEWQQALHAFEDAYVAYLNATLDGSADAATALQLRHAVLRAIPAASDVLGKLRADLAWFPPPAAGGPVMRGLENMVFLHEMPWGGIGAPPYQLVLDAVVDGDAALELIDGKVRRKRKNPLYWADRGLRALLGLPAYVVSLVFGVPLSRIEESAWGTALRVASFAVEVCVLVLGVHELRVR